MASFQDRSFICDDKFTQVIVEMGKRGWRRHQIEDSGRPGGGGAVLPPRDCELIWRNLASTHFQSVFGRCVNHFRGSNHLSNKAFLAYHLAATGRGGLLPSTWSASYESTHALVCLLCTGGLVSLITRLCEGGSDGNSDSTGRRLHGGCHAELAEHKEVLAALQMEVAAEEEEAMERGGHSAGGGGAGSIGAETAAVAALVELTAALLSATAAGAVICHENRDSVHGGDGNGGSGRGMCVWARIEKWVALEDAHAMKAPTGVRVAHVAVREALTQVRRLAPDLVADPSATGSRSMWIVKPVGGSCGQNIEVVSGMRAALAAARAMALKCVVQRYIELPLLLTGGRKFDIRQWVLVTDTNPLTVWGFSEFYCRLSADAHDLSESKLRDRAVHLCNHAVQVEYGATAGAGAGAGAGTGTGIGTDAGTGTREEEEGVFVETCTMMSQGALRAWLVETYGSVTAEAALARLQRDIRAVSCAAVTSAVDRLERVGKGFEWLGLDLMICDPTGHPEDWAVKLIEVNVSPDVSLSTRVTARLVPTATKTLLDIVLGDGGDSVDVEPKDEGGASASTSASVGELHWALWHRGVAQKTGFASTMTAAKEANLPFGTGYGPRAVHVLERVEAVLGVHVDEERGTAATATQAEGVVEEAVGEEGGSSDEEI